MLKSYDMADAPMTNCVSTRSFTVVESTVLISPPEDENPSTPVMLVPSVTFFAVPPENVPNAVVSSPTVPSMPAI